MANVSYEDVKPVINGIALPPPTKFDLSWDDLDSPNSLRDIKRGVLHREVIRSNVLKISFAYNVEELATLSTVLELCRKKVVQVEAFDIESMTRKTYNMYISKPKTSLIAVGNGVFSKGFAFDLTEC